MHASMDSELPYISKAEAHKIIKMPSHIQL